MLLHTRSAWPNGKTEAWYVLAPPPMPRLLLASVDGLSARQLREAIHEGSFPI